MRISGLLLVCSVAEAVRVELDVAHPPYVCTASDSAPVLWSRGTSVANLHSRGGYTNRSTGTTGRLLHQHSIVEINVDGMRFASRRHLAPENSTACRSARHSLCALGNASYIFASDVAPTVTSTTHPQPLLVSPNPCSTFRADPCSLADASHKQAYVQSTNSCATSGAGAGRVFSDRADRYDVSACDLLLRRYSFIYDLDEETLAVVHRPLPPMVYPLLLALCVVHLCGLAAPEISQTGYNIHTACALASVAIVLITHASHPPYSLAASDLWYQVFTSGAALLYSAARMSATSAQALHHGACIHALVSLGDL